jgi:hypothetical protein
VKSTAQRRQGVSPWCFICSNGQNIFGPKIFGENIFGQNIFGQNIFRQDIFGQKTTTKYIQTKCILTKDAEPYNSANSYVPDDANIFKQDDCGEN